jgi:hypothetical protein
MQRFFPEVIEQKLKALQIPANKDYCQFDSQASPSSSVVPLRLWAILIVQHLLRMGEK